jgi:diaminohydroxyphosphoribosylaminopyrimidine deaminase / 5-amino-6-(5-phosphoribosylamino)uracil reductase
VVSISFTVILQTYTITELLLHQSYTILQLHEPYMQRCLQLAIKGRGNVLANPLVGAVLVYNDRIIGEGWHQQYGQAHAEVNCINSVLAVDEYLIKEATLYVSLEPCNHQGKTPACTAFILAKQIKKVVVGCKDTNALVNGSGIDYLRKQGVTVICFVLEQACIKCNEAFFYSKAHKMPWITLKWTATADGFITNTKRERIAISNELTNRYVHQLRAAHSAILVGSGTVQADNPQLNSRLYGATSLTRIVIDRYLKLSTSYKIFDQSLPTIILNTQKHGMEYGVQYIKIADGETFLQQALQCLYTMHTTTILVEGGAVVLAAFYQQGYWNRLIRITNTALCLENGLASPTIKERNPEKTFYVENDFIEEFMNTEPLHSHII